jgi:very-short-patch-repair endonuclease
MGSLRRAQTYRARQLRRLSTPAEDALWDLLRARRLAGLKFRRQQPLGPYVVDFYCEEAALVVEADGPIHYQRQAYDRARDTFLEKAGLAVLRFTNEQILAKPRSVLRRIVCVAEPRSSRVSPPFSLREKGRG